MKKICTRLNLNYEKKTDSVKKKVELKEKNIEEDYVSNYLGYCYSLKNYS